MRRLLRIPLVPVTLWLGLVTAAAVGFQVPDTLQPSIPPPAGAFLQSGAHLGKSVAVDGAFVAAGAPEDDMGGGDSGTVKVFDSVSGALRFVIPNPRAGSGFGQSVALSGTRLVVGAYMDDTGANNSGAAFVFDLAGVNPTVPVFTLFNPSPGADDYFGLSVAISGTRVVIGAKNDDTGASDAGSAYAYDISAVSPLPVVLNNPGPASGENFGASVAVSGSRVVVGADRESTGAAGSGSVYVYEMTGLTPRVPVFTLPNPSPAVNDYFGGAVAISGNRVAVGAVGDDRVATNGGTAYVFDLAGASPTVPAFTLNKPSSGGGDGFGGAVAVSGTRVVAGAAFSDRTYVFDVSRASPTVPAYTFSNPSPGNLDYFGGSVAVSGTKIVIGAWDDDTGQLDAGSAYVYDLTRSSPLVPQFTLNSPGPDGWDLFGNSVALSGSRMVVGSPGDKTGATDAGSACVFDLAGAAPDVPVVTLFNPAPAQGDGFGAVVAISGTLVVVSTPGDDTGASDAGIVYVYDVAGANPGTPVAVISNPEPEAAENFGAAAAISGTRVVVGAPGSSFSLFQKGSAYVFDLTSAVPAVPAVVLKNTPAEGDRFGCAVAISGTRVVVGAKGENVGTTRSGRVYVYDLTRPVPGNPAVVLNNPDSNTLTDEFGSSVAISDARVVVGASGDNSPSGSGGGSAWVFDLTRPVPAAPVAALRNPSPANFDTFGYSVGISGTRIVVGARADDTGATDSGTAYVFDLAAPSPTTPVATLSNPSPSADDFFGNAVAIAGTTVAVGAPGDDKAMLNKGYVYLFAPRPDVDADGLRDSWELSYWPDTTGHAAGDDFDQDGYSELMELALGLNPTVKDAGGLPAVTVENGYLTLTVTRHPGVSYQIQSAGEGPFSPESTTIMTNTATTLKARDNVPVGAAGARFMRLKVTATP